LIPVGALRRRSGTSYADGVGKSQNRNDKREKTGGGCGGGYGNKASSTTHGVLHDDELLGGSSTPEIKRSYLESANPGHRVGQTRERRVLLQIGGVVGVVVGRLQVAAH
jgi:hypothetical protein